MNHDNKFYLEHNILFINFDEIAKKKNQNAAWVNAVNSKGQTPLHIATKTQKYKLIQTMLPHCKDINVSDNHGNTILHSLLDMTNNSKELTSTLAAVMSRGADPNRANSSGVTPVHLAVTHCNTRLLDAFKPRADFYLRTSDGETAVFLVYKSALRLGDTAAGAKTIEYLMSLGCDLNGRDDKGYSVLHYAVNSNNSCSDKIVKMLIKLGADVNIQTSSHKLTPLHVACQSGSKSKFDTLVRAGASIRAVSADGRTPLHAAVLSNSTRLMRSLISYGVDVNYAEDFAPLHVAVLGNCEDAFKLLIRKGADVNVESRDGLTPLHLSSALGDYWFVKDLVDRKADVNCRDRNGYTPLHFAIRNRETDKGYLFCKEYSFISDLLTNSHSVDSSVYETIVDLLINSGSDVNALTKNGVSPLHRAAQTGDVILVIKLLDHKAMINCVETVMGLTPLHVALMNHREDVAELLINSKANVQIATKVGECPLHLAAKMNSADITEALISRGAAVNCTDSCSGFTSLHVACRYNAEGTVRALIRAGADVNVLSKNDTSSLHQTVESSSIEILRLLMEHGAKLNCPGKRCRYTLLYLMSCDESTANFKFDIGETWLHWTLSQLSERKTKEMFLGLCAFVDLHDKNSCMPVHRLLHNNRIQHFKCSTTFGLYVDVFDVYGKSIFHLSMDNVGFRIHESKFMYLYKIRILGLPVAEMHSNYLNYTTFTYFPNLQSAKHPEFLREVQKLKNYFVKKNVSLYTLLHMKPKDRCRYTKILNIPEIEVQFPLYCELINGCYNDAMVRGSLIKAAHFALHQLVNLDLPMLCVEEICGNLCVISLIALIQAVEIVDTNNK